eukprot:800187-Rhodomonas_salina.1
MFVPLVDMIDSPLFGSLKQVAIGATPCEWCAGVKGSPAAKAGVCATMPPPFVGAGVDCTMLWVRVARRVVRGAASSWSEGAGLLAALFITEAFLAALVDRSTVLVPFGFATTLNGVRVDIAFSSSAFLSTSDVWYLAARACSAGTPSSVASEAFCEKNSSTFMARTFFGSFSSSILYSLRTQLAILSASLCNIWHRDSTAKALVKIDSHLTTNITKEDAEDRYGPTFDIQLLQQCS